MRQISVTPVGFEPVIPAITQLQTYALDRTATGMFCEIRIAVEVPDWKDDTALRTAARNMQLSSMMRPRRANVHSEASLPCSVTLVAIMTSETNNKVS